MEKNEIDSVNDVIRLLDEGMGKLKEAMKAGDEVKFNNMKKEISDNVKKIGEIISEKKEVKKEA